MAFLKKAKAGIVHPNFTAGSWQNFVQHHESRIHTPYRTASRHNANLVNQASEILKEQFNPSKYLLSHATILASVDTMEVPNVKLGATQDERGMSINRLWSDYRITPQTQKYANNNGDSWSRPVVLKSYRTFIGAENFLEHVQVPELSKGKILDAVVRDVGESLYVDILVATDRKHEQLIRDIKSGKMNAMSMGCTVSQCACTKCGNVASDETDMCAHIKYEKGNTFLDENGVQHRIVEICGHESLDPTGGVNFIEASWVATPAFTGAALRNVLEPETLNIRTQDQIRNVLAAPPKKWVENETIKAANLKTPTSWDRFDVTKLGFDFEEETETTEETTEDESESDSLEDIEKDIEEYALNRVKMRLKEKLKTKKQQDAAYGGEMATSKNENINKQAYRTHVAKLASISRNDADLMDRLARLNGGAGIKISTELYRTALRVGSTAKQGSVERYLAAASKILGRTPTPGEAKTLVRLGRILSMREKTHS